MQHSYLWSKFFSQTFRKYNYKFEHGNNQINDSETANLVISTGILNGTNTNKRKREKDLIINDNSPVDKIYFYENYLK